MVQGNDAAGARTGQQLRDLRAGLTEDADQRLRMVDREIGMSNDTP